MICIGIFLVRFNGLRSRWMILGILLDLIQILIHEFTTKMAFDRVVVVL